jgi:hypothetical protein
MSLLVTGGDLQAREREIGFRGCQPATPGTGTRPCRCGAHTATATSRSNCEAQKIPATGSSRRLEPAPKSLNWFSRDSRVQRRTSHVTRAASARPVGRAERGPVRFDFGARGRGRRRRCRNPHRGGSGIPAGRLVRTSHVFD